MKKIVLIDGNNFMFRAFYAIRDHGGNLRTSSGMSTNALYGFTNMINKIISEEKPEYIAVAFDKGKNFRKEEFDFYKAGRKETPEELKEQFPVVKEMLTLMGIKYIELEPYEADDIIGTLAKEVNSSEDFTSLIISSDVDLMQLIDKKSEMKLLKSKGNIRYTREIFEEEYLLEPKRIVDLKALMGDTSDNIPGVKGIGEKTALKLLQEYKTLDNLYENIENLKGTQKEKILNDKENAYISYKLATIFCDVPLKETLEDFKYIGEQEGLYELYEKLEFKTFLRNKSTQKKELKIIEVTNITDLILSEEFSLYAEFDDNNYHTGKVVSVSICDNNKNYFIKKELISDLIPLLKNKKISTYNIKKHLKIFGDVFTDDLMISEFLLNNNTLDDISSILVGIEDEYTYMQLKKDFENVENLKMAGAIKAEFIKEELKESIEKLQKENLYNLYTKIELPLTKVLYSMENQGIYCDENILNDLGELIVEETKKVTEKIYTLAGEEFNVGSPKKLGEILFEKLEIAKGKKNKTGYVTDASTLEKLKNKHEIINYILQFRNLEKINNTYIKGTKKYINENKKIKPIFKQTFARTGRLSCSEPNLQNIPVREELGKQIRKAFIPVNDLFLSFDYSQIELRIMAHISEDEKLIAAFNEDKDIHRSVAADMYNKKEEEITKEERKTAKAVIFGIVYGISGFGLGENLKVTRKEAEEFIQKYYELYPNVKKYMDDIIIKTKELGYVTTLYNRKRKIEEINSSVFMVKQLGERQALNTPIQGTSADIIKVAMIKIHNEFIEKNIKSKMILQVHDELIFDVIKEEKEIVSEIVMRNMENVIKLRVPLLVQGNEGTNWYEV
ncbi:MAG: DNA polymerase I [bacterium]